MAREVIESDETEEAGIRSIGVLNLLLGIWLIVTPFWFNYTTGAARWNQVIIGIVVVVLSGLRALLPSQRWLSNLVGLAGLWAIVAPFILNYNMAGAYWNEVIVGIIVALLAFYNSSLPSIEHRTHHHTPA